jgi:hypothetical protein
MKIEKCKGLAFVACKGTTANEESMDVLDPLSLHFPPFKFLSLSLLFKIIFLSLSLLLQLSFLSQHLQSHEAKGDKEKAEKS